MAVKSAGRGSVLTAGAARSSAHHVRFLADNGIAVGLLGSVDER